LVQPLLVGGPCFLLKWTLSFFLSLLESFFNRTSHLPAALLFSAFHGFHKRDCFGPFFVFEILMFSFLVHCLLLFSFRFSPLFDRPLPPPPSGRAVSPPLDVRASVRFTCGTSPPSFSLSRSPRPLGMTFCPLVAAPDFFCFFSHGRSSPFFPPARGFSAFF